MSLTRALSVANGTVFKQMAARFKAKGIEAEAVMDATGKPASLRFHVVGRAFALSDLLALEGGQIRVEIEAYETPEPERPEDRIGHMQTRVPGRDRFRFSWPRCDDLEHQGVGVVHDLESPVGGYR